MKRRAQNNEGTGAQQVLGPLEAEVMRVIWNLPNSTTGEVSEIINRQRIPPLAYRTVLTILSRLEKKGWVFHEADGRAFRYTATKTEKEMTEIQAQREVSEVLEKFGNLAVAGFVELTVVDPAYLTRLEELLKERKNNET
jgi:predicted transcriptional regulator